MAGFLLVIASWWFLNGRSFKIPRLARVDLTSGAFTADDPYKFNSPSIPNGSSPVPEMIPFLSYTSANTAPPAPARFRPSGLPVTLQTPVESYSLPAVRSAQDPLLKKVVIWILNAL